MKPSAESTAICPKVFIVFGMPRSGTTYLYRTLAFHPSIFVPYRKESHFFSVNYRKGLDWFSELYEGMPADTIGADVNPMYYLDPLAIDRILDYDKDVKIILGVREPVDFAISLYGNMRIHGLELPSIIDVVQQFTWPLTPEEGLSFSLANDFLTNRVTELSDVFGDHLLLYDYNYFNQSPLPVLNAIEKFLKLKPHFNEDNFENLRINASGRRDPFRLNALFANQRVLDLLYAWLPKSTIRKLRSLYEELSVKGRKTEDKRTSGPNRVDDAERRELEDCFRGDRIYYENLFRDMPIRLGSGQGI